LQGASQYIFKRLPLLTVVNKNVGHIGRSVKTIHFNYQILLFQGRGMKSRRQERTFMTDFSVEDADKEFNA